MEKLDPTKVDSRILELSEKFQKILKKPTEPSVLVGIKRELEYWRQQKKMLSAKNNLRRAF